MKNEIKITWPNPDMVIPEGTETKVQPEADVRPGRYDLRLKGNTSAGSATADTNAPEPDSALPTRRAARRWWSKRYQAWALRATCTKR